MTPSLTRCPLAGIHAVGISEIMGWAPEDSNQFIKMSVYALQALCDAMHVHVFRPY